MAVSVKLFDICESVFDIEVNSIPIMLSFKRIKRQQYVALCWLQLFAFALLDQCVYSDIVSTSSKLCLTRLRVL